MTIPGRIWGQYCSILEVLAPKSRGSSCGVSGLGGNQLDFGDFRSMGFRRNMVPVSGYLNSPIPNFGNERMGIAGAPGKDSGFTVGFGASDYRI